MKLKLKKELLQKRRWRIRKKVKGSAERPRLTVKFTQKHMHAQCIDDVSGKTLVALSTVSPDLRKKNLSPNVSNAAEFGSLFAEKIKGAGAAAVVFDRGGRSYHGAVKAFADSVREKGIKF